MRRHIAGAEQLAQGRRVRTGGLERLVRALLLDELRRYRERGRFPLNHDFRGRRVPHFIDAHGTRCAVGHLMEVSGQGELVRHIAQTRNNARMAELAVLPEVRAWLAAAGLGLDEAARIQPAYSCTRLSVNCFCAQAGQVGVALGSVLDEEASSSLPVRIERIEGELTGFRVGDQVDVEVSSSQIAYPGAFIFLARNTDDGRFARIGPSLFVDGDTVTCNDALGPAPSVSIDTAFEALLAAPSACEALLESQDPAWVEPLCFGEGSDIVRDEGCGVAHAPSAGLGFGELTSAALLVAILRWRRQRRRTG